MREELRERRRIRILEAAREVFRAKGFSRAKTSDVVRAARVSNATLYAYFESKEALFDAFAMRELERYRGRFELAERRAGDARTVLRQFARTYFDFMASPELRGVYRMVGAETDLRPDLGAALYRNAHDLLGGGLRRILARLEAQGDLAFADLAVASRLLEGMLEAVTLFPSILGGDEVATGVDPEAYSAHVVEVFLAAYRPEN